MEGVHLIQVVRRHPPPAEIVEHAGQIIVLGHLLPDPTNRQPNPDPQLRLEIHPHHPLVLILAIQGGLPFNHLPRLQTRPLEQNHRQPPKKQNQDETVLLSHD